MSARRKSLVLQQTELNLERVTRERDAAALALSDLVAGRVTWFKNEFREIGVSRETGAHGGLVIIRDISKDGWGSDYASAYYFEYWFSYYRNYAPPSNDAELCAVRDLAFEVANHVREKQETLLRSKEVS